MSHAAGTGAGSFALAVAMWQAMIVAMMTPTVLPWISAYGRLAAQPPAAPRWRASLPFASGYLAIWTAYSIAIAALQVFLARGGVFHLDRLEAPLGGAVLVAAGLFQFAPVKAACLTHCRNPLSYFLAHWKNGPIGGFRLGISHGTYCLGCCWLLMLTGFGVGVMNLAWMALLTLVVVAEQVAPWGVHVGRVAGAGLVAWGLWQFA